MYFVHQESNKRDIVPGRILSLILLIPVPKLKTEENQRGKEGGLKHIYSYLSCRHPDISLGILGSMRQYGEPSNGAKSHVAFASPLNHRVTLGGCQYLWEHGVHMYTNQGMASGRTLILSTHIS